MNGHGCQGTTGERHGGSINSAYRSTESREPEENNGFEIAATCLLLPGFMHRTINVMQCINVIDFVVDFPYRAVQNILPYH